MAQSLTELQFDTALAMAESADAGPAERAEMLMEIAMGLQNARAPAGGDRAVQLYRRALALCPDSHRLLAARIQARLGTALHAAAGDRSQLEQARSSFEQAAPTLEQLGSRTELAELQMNLGLTLQALAGLGLAPISQAIAQYQAALRVFGRDQHPREFAILHNNLAVAFLSIPSQDPRSRLSEALAVRSFEQVLGVINRREHPREWAMAQNNLGNALQYAASGHPLDNKLRALQAYDAALEVRRPQDNPLEYANTIANKANLLRQLESADGPDLQAQALALYREARHLFASHGRDAEARLLDRALSETAHGSVGGP